MAGDKIASVQAPPSVASVGGLHQILIEEGLQGKKEKAGGVYMVDELSLIITPEPKCRRKSSCASLRSS